MLFLGAVISTELFGGIGGKMAHLAEERIDHSTRSCWKVSDPSTKGVAEPYIPHIQQAVQQIWFISKVFLRVLNKRLFIEILTLRSEYIKDLSANFRIYNSFIEI